MKSRMTLAVGFAAALGSAPAFAQTTTPPNPSPPPPQQAATMQGNATAGTATINPTGTPPSERNPLLTDQGLVRINKLIGSTIYNKDDKDIGSVQDVVADQQGQAQVVVSTHGKQVLVPWNKLEFGDAKLNSHNKVLMLDSTEQSLASMPPYNPQAARNKGNNKG
ncbi:MAG TPA: PRC-barrel domain-containing protein [Acetobacteraceae bacterium]|nr:PRC-barrel domain-containing protein [Acetobacteraceae bacterium]